MKIYLIFQDYKSIKKKNKVLKKIKMLEFKAEMLAVSTPNMTVMLGASLFEYVISNVMYGNF